MSDKTYKAIFVPQELHDKVKLSAVKNKITMIEYLQLLQRDFELKGIVVKFDKVL